MLEGCSLIAVQYHAAYRYTGVKLFVSNKFLTHDKKESKFGERNYREIVW